jgi:hypothetical protein
VPITEEDVHHVKDEWGLETSNDDLSLDGRFQLRVSQPISSSGGGCDGLTSAEVLNPKPHNPNYISEIKKPYTLNLGTLNP